MRYSRAAVQMFHLGKLVDGIAKGSLGIPEFQRDFDWSETDIRSLLATVFAGWPAGSLLLLEGSAPIFSLRPFEKAPILEPKINYAVLDGQQRLTSMYHALYDVGDSIFAVKWDLPDDQELEDCIVSYRRDVWKRQCSQVTQQLEKRIIPVSALKNPTTFFAWRDSLLATIDDGTRLSSLRDIVTNFYTYRLSSLHDYEFPAVLLDSDIDPDAIARIFEKVNKTGLTLNAFDLMVAKSFDPGWNLRDKWTEARQNYPDLGSFLQDDGMPLLQAIALLQVGDLRQASVLSVSKASLHQRWDDIASASARIINFLRRECGVLKRDFMPYTNLLAPFIALETEGRVSADPDIFSCWFWYASFAGAYDVAANTRLVSHYRAVRSGNFEGFRLADQRTIKFTTATKKNEKALWNAVNCAIVKYMEERLGTRLPISFSEEIEVTSLYSVDEVRETEHRKPTDHGHEIEFRSVLNSFLSPRRLSPVIKKAGGRESVLICHASEFGIFANAQLPVDITVHDCTWDEYRAEKARWLTEFVSGRGVGNVRVIGPMAGIAESFEIEL